MTRVIEELKFSHTAVLSALQTLPHVISESVEDNICIDSALLIGILKV